VVSHAQGRLDDDALPGLEGEDAFLYRVTCHQAVYQGGTLLAVGILELGDHGAFSDDFVQGIHQQYEL
jgi:hypothetical protein